MSVADQSQEEWWTTEMVCRYLKISRGALWLQRRAEGSEFPHSIRFGGKRNLYPALKVREWAERKSWAIQGGPNPLHVTHVLPRCGTAKQAVSDLKEPSLVTPKAPSPIAQTVERTAPQQKTRRRRAPGEMPGQLNLFDRK